MDIIYNFFCCIIWIVDNLIAPGTSVSLCINISYYSFSSFLSSKLKKKKKEIQTYLLLFVFFGELVLIMSIKRLPKSGKEKQIG